VRNIGRYRKTKRFLKQELARRIGQGLVNEMRLLTGIDVYRDLSADDMVALIRARHPDLYADLFPQQLPPQRVLPRIHRRVTSPTLRIHRLAKGMEPDDARIPTEPTDCVICLDDIREHVEDTANRGVVSHCTNNLGQDASWFHASCLQRWIDGDNDSCPACQGRLDFD
jgi:hypothetical protein